MRNQTRNSSQHGLIFFVTCIGPSRCSRSKPRFSKSLDAVHGRHERGLCAGNCRSCGSIDCEANEHKLGGKLVPKLDRGKENCGGDWPFPGVGCSGPDASTNEPDDRGGPDAFDDPDSPDGLRKPDSSAAYTD